MEPKRVLVVDDDAEVLAVLREILEHGSYEVETVNAPMKTVATLLTNRYDAVTVDLKMPEMDGTDVAELVRVLDNQVPVVVISGFLTPGVKARFKEMGIQYFIDKPFRAQEILNVLGAAIQGGSSAS